MSNIRNILIAIGFLATQFTHAQLPNTATNQKTLAYPSLSRDNQIDDYFGTKVTDPYRWLEDDNSEKTKRWVKRQNDLTFSYLDNIQQRQKLRKQFEAANNYEKISQPFKVGDYYLFAKNTGLQNQSVYYIQKGIEGVPEVFFDPNLLSKDGTVAASLGSSSKSKKYITITISESGSDWQRFEVMEVATKKKLKDDLRWVKFSGTSWNGDDGFFYSRYDAPTGNALTSKNEFHKVYYHKLGTAQESDRLVYQDLQNPLRFHSANLTPDGAYLILSVSQGTSGNAIYVQKQGKKNQKGFIKLVDNFRNDYQVITHQNGKLYIKTNLDAPNGRLIAINPNRPTEIETIIAETENKLNSVSFAGGKFFGSYLVNVSTQVFQFSIKGKIEHSIELPGIGTVSGFGGEEKDKELFFTFSSFTTPPTVYIYNIDQKTTSVFMRSNAPVDPDAYVVEQEFFKSTDGKTVPMFLIYRKDLKRNGKVPTLLYGYGGFNIAITPSFSPNRMPLLDNGGMLVIANIRGGSEFGQAWHEAGMLMKKQQVFDDFIKAAEHLIDMGYTSKDYLAILGRSNGGLLVGACMTQRPDLFKVAFPGVGVLDMLRFHKFTIGWGWVVEYGSSEQSEQMFNYLYKYSPLHNIKPGQQYPATLITTADHDDRVVPAHSFKFAATLQEANLSEVPTLIRIDTNAGHGAGRSISKIIEEETDVLAFMLYNMGLID